MEDKKIQNLIQLAIIDTDRRALYQKALPRMTAEEKLDFALDLWAILMDKLHARALTEMQAMIDEMADPQSTVEYSRKEFQAVQERILNEMMRERLGITEEEELAKLREELSEIGEKVQTHEQEIAQLKEKVE